MPRVRRSPIVVALALSAIALLSAGCGSSSQRTPQAYCRAYYSKAAPIRRGYLEDDRQAKTNPLGTLVKLLAAPGDLESIFAGMVDHAPDDIKDDTAQVRDAFKQLASSEGESLANPLKALTGNLGTALSASGAFTRVDAYLQANCPVNGAFAQQVIKESGG
jgi:hypothetical protein